MDQTATSTEPLKLRTTHVRINITQADLDKFRKSSTRTDRANAVAHAINRVLRDGYEATFDGLSVGILTKYDIDGDPLFAPVWRIGDPDIYEEGTHAYYRMCEGSSTSPFFRGVSARVQKIHKLNSAHRKTSPARVTISLPDCALRRTMDDQPMEIDTDL